MMEFDSTNPLHPLLKDLQLQQQQLFTYAKSLEISDETINEVLQNICERISTTMNCERVSIWLFDEDDSLLISQNIYEAGVGHSASADVLLKSQKPSYFKAILENRILAIEDISTEPATQELLEDYFSSGKRVHSMLDASIILSKGVGGVLCCETGTKRTWTSLEKIVVAAIADMLSFLFDRLYRINVEEYMHDLAFNDRLTGLDNEHSFNDKVTKKLRCLNSGKRGLFVYFVLDQFTQIQSVLGHEGGEAILVKTAERLRNLFPAPAVTARIGFDHFVIYYPFYESRAERQLDLELIAKALKAPMDILGQEVYLTFSYGIAYYPDHAKTATQGVQAARLALESGQKKSSRKARGIYKPSMHTAMQEMMVSEMNLRRGLDSKEFCLYYQPQVDAQTGELVGFEALIRWQHPEKGLIFPGDFIELAESTGLIVPIGEWVIQQAFTQLREWHLQGYDNLTVSINLSPRHFLYPKLLTYLKKHLKETGIAAERVVIEITENVAMENLNAVKKRIFSLVELGFTVSIDDFGTGYSAFIYLQHLSIQEIKIDRQFVNALSPDPKSMAVIETIIHLAKMLGLRTVAEGVETNEQWEILRRMGCNVIQGYYFGRPLRIDDIDTLLGKTIESKKIYLPS